MPDTVCIINSKWGRWSLNLILKCFENFQNFCSNFGYGGRPVICICPDASVGVRIKWKHHKSWSGRDFGILFSDSHSGEQSNSAPVNFLRQIFHTGFDPHYWITPDLCSVLNLVFKSLTELIVFQLSNIFFHKSHQCSVYIRYCGLRNSFRGWFAFYARSANAQHICQHVIREFHLNCKSFNTFNTHPTHHCHRCKNRS